MKSFIIAVWIMTVAVILSHTASAFAQAVNNTAQMHRIVSQICG